MTHEPFHERRAPRSPSRQDAPFTTPGAEDDDVANDGELETADLERRIREIETGRVRLVSAEESDARVESLLAELRM